jgi:hypothetical protein
MNGKKTIYSIDLLYFMKLKSAGPAFSWVQQVNDYAAVINSGFNRIY